MQTPAHPMHHLLAALLLVHLSRATTTSATVNTTNLANQCQNWRSQVSQLQEFSRFHQQFSQLNEQLHRANKLQAEQQHSLIDTEATCLRNGLVFGEVSRLGALVDHFRQGKPGVCGIRFVYQVQRLNARLSDEEDGESPLLQVVHLLARQLAARCSSSLDTRLEHIERSVRRDSLVQLAQIGRSLAAGAHLDALERQFGLLQVSPYVPLLGPPLASARLAPPGGEFEFPLSRTGRSKLAAARLACSSLHLLQLNTLGSLGLLAEMGFSAQHLYEESPRHRRWLMAALLCQALRTAKKVSHAKVGGGAASRLLVGPVGEAEFDLEAEEEEDLEELSRADEAAGRLEGVGEPAPGVGGRKAPTRDASVRQQQLLMGPNYRWASSLAHLLEGELEPSRKELLARLFCSSSPREEAEADDEDEDEDEDEMR